MESDIWNKPATWFKLWIYMLFKANFADGNVKRGELLLNYSMVKNEIPDLSHSAYKRELVALRQANMIRTRQRTRYICVTILNYNTYQDNPRLDEPEANCPRTAGEPETNFYIKRIKKEEIKEKESQQEVLPVLPDLQNFSSIKTSSLNGIVSNNKVDNSRPPTSAISSSPSITFSDLTNPDEFIAYYFSSIKRLRGVTINLKAEDLLYAKKAIESVPRAFRTSENIKSWATWYLSEYLSKNPSREYFWITSFSASWEMFYLRKLSNKSMMTLEEGAQPNESTELLQDPEVLIKTLRKTIQEYQRNITLPDNIRPIDIIVADCIYDVLKTERYYNVRSLNEWVQSFAMVYLRHYPMKTNSHSKYVMYFRSSWDKIKRVLREPVWAKPSNDTCPDNLMARISKMFTKGVMDETLLKSMSLFGVQVTANYMQYKLNQANVETRIVGVFNETSKSDDQDHRNILINIYTASLKFSPKKYVSDKLLISNWRNNNLKFWKWALMEYLYKFEHLYQSEHKLVDEFYEELLGKPDAQKKI